MTLRDAASLLVGLLVLCHTWGAWAVLEVNMEGRVEVYRGGTAQITCMFVSAEGIGGTIIQWFYVTVSGERRELYFQDSTMRYAERGTPFTDRISVNGTGATGEVVLTINNVQVTDEVEFICSVKNPFEGVGEGRTRLNVFVMPNMPSIEGVQTGITISEDLAKIGTCEVKNGYPKPNLTWYRNRTPLSASQDGVEITPTVTKESSGLVSVKSELSMMVVKENKDDEFYCEVTYLVPGETRMTETNRINITIYYPSTALNIWVESPKGKIKEGDLIELHCKGNGNSPSEISIKHEGTTLGSEMLELRNVTRLNSGVYECSSFDLHTYDEISANTTVFVNYLDPAVVRPEDSNVVAQGGELKATCNALSTLQTHAVWFKNGKEVSKGHTLILKDATFDKAGKYTCVVTVPEIEGMKTNGSLHIHVQGPPEIMEPDLTEMVESAENTVKLSCNARGYPAPSITWTTSDGEVLKTASQKNNDKGVESVLTFKVTSDIKAFCNASNKHGTDMVVFSIKTTTHTTTPASTTTNTTTTTISSTTVKSEIAVQEKIKNGGSGVIIAVIIVCVLLLAILGSVLYFLYKKGKICGRSGKEDLTKKKSSKDNIVVEMKSDNTEEAVLLGVNGEKQPPSD